MQKALIFLIIIFTANLFGMYYNLYWNWWFDMSLHFLGGFFVAMFMVYYLADVMTPTKLKKYLVLTGAVILVGVVWEFAEYLASQILAESLYNNFGFRAYFIGDLDDTINYLLMDILGAISFLAIFRKN